MVIFYTSCACKKSLVVPSVASLLWKMRIPWLVHPLLPSTVFKFMSSLYFSRTWRLRKFIHDSEWPVLGHYESWCFDFMFYALLKVEPRFWTPTRTTRFALQKWARVQALPLNHQAHFPPSPRVRHPATCPATPNTPWRAPPLPPPTLICQLCCPKRLSWDWRNPQLVWPYGAFDRLRVASARKCLVAYNLNRRFP